MENNNYFVERILRKYLFPTILTILGTTIISFINSIIAGKILGKEALTAMNIVSSFTFLFAMFGCLINIGAASCASVAIGEDDQEKVGAYTSYALAGSIVIPILISVPCMIFFEEFMRILGADEALYLLSADYARIMLAFGFLTTLMYYPFNFLRLDGRAKSATYIFGSMALIDVLLVLLFMHFSLGLFGFGLAVVISTAVADIVGLLFLFLPSNSHVKLGKLTFRGVGRLSGEVWARGSAAGLNNLCNMLRTMVLNAWVLRYMGVNGASEFAVACSVINFTAASVSGCGQTISPLVGIFYGEKDVTSMRMLMKSAVKYAVMLHFILCLVAIPASRLIAGLYGMDTEPLVSETASAVDWVVISLIPAAIVNIYIYYYSTLKKTVISCTLTFARAFGFVILFAWFLLVSGHIRFFFASFLLAELSTILLMTVIVYAAHMRNPTISGFLLMNNTPNENYISFSVENTAAGAVDASEKMAAFCDENSINPKFKMLLPMALEELLIIVNDHCLNDRGNQYIDVRIFLDQDGLLLRIRCGGIVFDPVAWYRNRSRNMSVEEMIMDDSLGMKMIVEQAKSVTFQNTFGMNNLIVVM